MQKLYKATELAEILGLNVQTIYRMADRGEIEDFRIGNTRRFLMPDDLSVIERDRQNNE